MTPVFRSSSSATNRTWKKTGRCHGPVPSRFRRRGAMRPITKQARAAAPMSTRRLWISAGRLSAKTWLRRKCARWRRETGEGRVTSIIDGDIEDGSRQRSHGVIYCEGTKERVSRSATSEAPNSHIHRFIGATCDIRARKKQHIHASSKHSRGFHNHNF